MLNNIVTIATLCYTLFIESNEQVRRNGTAKIDAPRPVFTRKEDGTLRTEIRVACQDRRNGSRKGRNFVALWVALNPPPGIPQQPMELQ